MSRLAATIVCLAMFLLALAVPARLHAQEPADGGSELATEARTLIESIAQQRDELGRLRDEGEQAQAEEQILLERRRLRLALETLANVDALVENVLEQEEQGLDTAEARQSAVELVGIVAPLARQRVAALEDEIGALGGQREETTGEALVKLENEIDEANATLSQILRAGLDNAEHMAALGLPADDEKAFFAAELTERAETEAERIRLSIEQIAALQGRLGEKPGDADLEAELSAAQAKKDAAGANLESTVEMMERLGLETADYRQLLIAASGQITTDILDTKVALSMAQQWFQGIRAWAVESGPGLIFKLLLFVIILLVFHLLARAVRRVVRRAVSTSKLKLSQLLQKMIVSTSGNAVIATGILVALSQLGFSLGPVLAGLGIAGFIVGFALQDTLANFAAGMMILLYRPFDVGDMIEAAGVFGKVSAMSLVSTTVLTIDNQTLVVPNGKIWGDVIKNVTAQTVRRVDMTFGIGYGDDIPKTEGILATIIKEHPKVLADPEPLIKLHTLGESSVDFIVRPWVLTDDYWDVYWDVTREVKMRFDREGISIPFPQRDVHIYREERIEEDRATGEPAA